MDFTQEVFETLKRYSEAEESIMATVINQFAQEFTVSGFIPKFHLTRDKGFDAKGAHSHYFILNFGKDDEKATIKLFCPNIEHKVPGPLTIKKVEDIYGNTLYENENYPWDMLNIRQTIIDMHKDANFWNLTDSEQKIANLLLGKAPIYMGNTYPEVKGKRCLITGIIPGLKPDTVALYLKHEHFKTFGLERVNIHDINKTFEIQSIETEHCETEDFLQ